ncbi:OFA family MFS transporter [Peptoniphilus sp. KCTC 25270]|uniref:L-lactate MFS transporter n=1 Tax=Peptoniphilus sp. KCTC 25270 TaxID=2897414 RepID=UPI001E28A8E2|nr:OFA family MFS transporter [Peptoniphilus sp. KCTC 25270]MCD1147506.1 OFA family MFS transporter [Peptoniphilus sp. KCTC 25270]
MNYTKKRWIILIVSCLINLCIGSMYAWSALAGPMAKELNVESLAIVFSISNAIGFVGMILGGTLNDKFGPRWVVFSGGLLFGLGMYLAGNAQSVTHLILTYGLMLGIGLAFVYGCTISNTIKFFPDRRGMVGGMTTAFYGISSVIFAPIASALNHSFGVRSSFHILGVVFMVIICAGAFIMQRCPVGFVPEGYIPPVVTNSNSAKDKTPGEMLRMPIFYVMLILLTCGATFGMMIISNAKGLAINMVSAADGTATLFVSILCLFNTAGRLVAGSISDKLGRINTITAALCIAIVALVSLLLAEPSQSVPLFSVGLILIGICFGTFMAVFPGFSTDMFGTKYNTVNYGIMWIGFSLAGIIGPMLLSNVYSTTGIYRYAFLISIALAAFGLLLTVVYRKMAKKA